MVPESTWRVQAVLGFILIRNYHGCVVDMDSLVQVNLHFSKGLQWFRGGLVFFPTNSFSYKGSSRLKESTGELEFHM